MGTDRIPIWKGAVFGVKSLVEHYYEKLVHAEAEDLDGLDVDFKDFRRKFESSTGISCSSFFENGEFQPLAATAILEEFLEGPEVNNYDEGVRYFFGHRIQD
jgi:hypothetical protein